MSESEPGEGGPVLLSGGNPQIPKGDGDAPVQAYIAAMPGWKSDLGRRLAPEHDDRYGDDDPRQSAEQAAEEDEQG